jgi:hypothetical protein
MLSDPRFIGVPLEDWGKQNSKYGAPETGILLSLLATRVHAYFDIRVLLNHFTTHQVQIKWLERHTPDYLRNIRAGSTRSAYNLEKGKK